MTDRYGSYEDDLVHHLKNQLSIILGFTDLLLEETEENDPRRRDFDEIRKAATTALAAMPQLSERLSSSPGDQ